MAIKVKAGTARMEEVPTKHGRLNVVNAIGNAIDAVDKAVGAREILRTCFANTRFLC